MKEKKRIPELSWWDKYVGSAFPSLKSDEGVAYGLLAKQEGEKLYSSHDSHMTENPHAYWREIGKEREGEKLYSSHDSHMTENPHAYWRQESGGDSTPSPVDHGFRKALKREKDLAEEYYNDGEMLPNLGTETPPAEEKSKLSTNQKIQLMKMASGLLNPAPDDPPVQIRHGQVLRGTPVNFSFLEGKKRRYTAPKGF